jgi:hypothetical protein
MHLTMTERQVGDVTVLDLVGKLTIDRDAQRLKDKINSLIQQTRTSKRNNDLLSITRLTTVFDTFDSEDDAVRSFPQLPWASPVASLAQ